MKDECVYVGRSTHILYIMWCFCHVRLLLCVTAALGSLGALKATQHEFQEVPVAALKCQQSATWCVIFDSDKDCDGSPSSLLPHTHTGARCSHRRGPSGLHREADLRRRDILPCDRVHLPRRIRCPHGYLPGWCPRGRGASQRRFRVTLSIYNDAKAVVYMHSCRNSLGILTLTVPYDPVSAA